MRFGLSCIRFSTAQWTVAHQAPLSMEFSKQEYWSRILLFPTPEDLPNPEIKPTSLHLLHWKEDFFLPVVPNIKHKVKLIFICLQNKVIASKTKQGNLIFFVIIGFMYIAHKAWSIRLYHRVKRDDGKIYH